MRKGNGLALVLIAFGVLLILGKLGIFGFLMGLLVPVLVIGLGVLAWRNGSRVLGGIVGAVGVLMLLGKMSHLFIWIAAIGLILFGVSMIRRNPRTGM